MYNNKVEKEIAIASLEYAIAERERRLDNSFFVIEAEQLKKEICDLNTELKKLLKK